MKPDSDLGLSFQIISIPFFQHFHPCHRRCRSQDRTVLLVLVGEQCCGIETFGLVVALRYTNGSLKRQLLGLILIWRWWSLGLLNGKKTWYVVMINEVIVNEYLLVIFLHQSKKHTYWSPSTSLANEEGHRQLSTLLKFHGEYHPPRIPPVSRPCKLGTYSQANDHSWPAGSWIPKTKLLKLREYTVFIRFWIVVFLGRLKFRIVFKGKANFKV